MRSRLLLASIAVVLVVPAAAASQTRPTVRLVNDSPLTLRGTRFKPGESVRITVVMGARTLSRQLRTGTLGGFTTRFLGVSFNYCVFPLQIRARGSVSGLVRVLIPIADCAMP